MIENNSDKICDELAEDAYTYVNTITKTTVLVIKGLASGQRIGVKMDHDELVNFIAGLVHAAVAIERAKEGDQC